MCVVFGSTLSDSTRHDFGGHYEKHQDEIEGIQYAVKKKEDVKKRQNLFVKRSSEVWQ